MTRFCQAAFYVKLAYAVVQALTLLVCGCTPADVPDNNAVPTDVVLQAEAADVHQPVLPDSLDKGSGAAGHVSPEQAGSLPSEHGVVGEQKIDADISDGPDATVGVAIEPEPEGYGPVVAVMPRHQTVLLLHWKYCRPCREQERMFPELRRLGVVITEYGSGKSANIHVVEVDTHPEVAEKYGEKQDGSVAVPQWVVVLGEEVIHRHVGVLTVDAIRELLKPVKSQVAFGAMGPDDILDALFTDARFAIWDANPEATINGLRLQIPATVTGRISDSAIQFTEQPKAAWGIFRASIARLELDGDSILATAYGPFGVRIRKRITFQVHDE